MKDLVSLSLSLLASSSSSSNGGCPMHASSTGGCPVFHVGGAGPSVKDFFPNMLNVKILSQNNDRVNPLDKNFDYQEALKDLDVRALEEDIKTLFTDSKDWWPADYGHYGPLFCRMSWHNAGTYRSFDGRGGAGTGSQRFSPVNSWTDNGNLDKARRLLWPIKQKYGQKLSWADLLAYAGNEAIKDMGFKTMGFGFGREDIWEPEEDVNWGAELEFGTNDKRYDEEGNPETLQLPLGADQQAWIYVNPEGFSGKPDPALSAKDIRTTFARMGMNDVETVALTAGGHTFGKTHGNGDMSKVGAPPEAAPMELMGLGWKNDNGSGKAGDTVTSGLEGAWTATPIKWDYSYFENMFGYEWELHESPAGSPQWRPKDGGGAGTVPDAHDPEKKHQPFMMTTDLAFKDDPAYRDISLRFRDNHEEFDEEFSKAWYKLLHRDMGPHARLHGPDVPEAQLWQDPVPPVDHPLIEESDIENLKQKIIDESGLSIARLVTTAWASASTYRNSDKRGGANGARIRLEPMKDWEINEPEELAKALDALEKVQQSFNDAASGGKKVSLSDVIVLGGVAAVEKAAKAGGFSVNVPFIPGRTDATQEMTDVEQAKFLKPVADGFRNHYTPGLGVTPEQFLIDRAHLLSLTAPEMTVLLAGLRVLGVGAKDTSALTDNVGVLSTDFFTNLFDMSCDWEEVEENLYEARVRSSGDLRWKATRADLVFGSNSILRAIGEVYAAEDGKEKFARDFCGAFGKVMHLDRFDIPGQSTTRPVAMNVEAMMNMV